MNWIARHRRLVLGMICAFWAGMILLTLTFPEAPFFSSVARGEQSFDDILARDGRKTATRSDFVFLGIDESTLNFQPFDPEDVNDNRAFQLLLEHPSPWSRELWAVMLDRLFAAGARVVMFDMIFGKPFEGDAEFRTAIDRYRDKVVLGVNYDQNSQVLVPPSPSLVSGGEHDDRVGYVNYFPDPLDGVIRTTRYFVSDRQLAGLKPFAGQEILTSFAARAVQKLGEGSRLPTALEPKLIRFTDADAYDPKPLWEIFDPKVWQANYHDGEFFKGKIVMIGAASQVAHDVVVTPLSSGMSGPVLHLNAIAAALSGEFLRQTPMWLRYVLVIAAGLMAWALIVFVRRLTICLVSLGGIAFAYLFATRLFYDHSGYLLMTVPVLATFITSGVTSLGWEYILERREKLKTRRTLERYVSKNLVKDILDNPASFYSSMKGARIPVTVLFTDLIGFTTLSERADPEELVRQLNEYLSKMVGVVFQNKGTLDKFIGDAIMAVWGNVQSAGPVADAKACARTALGMRRALKELNEGWRKESRMTLGMGVGINSGEALAGNIGSGDRADLTVIGDAVNLASRLEALTRTYGVDLLVGEAAVELIRDDFHLRSVARVQVKGKSIPVAVSTLLCAKGDDFDPELLKWIETYEEGIANFRGREFIKAKANFSRFIASYPEDYLAKMYLDRTIEYEKTPPDDSWNAAEVFTKK